MITLVEFKKDLDELINHSNLTWENKYNILFQKMAPYLRKNFDIKLDYYDPDIDYYDDVMAWYNAFNEQIDNLIEMQKWDKYKE